ncbi:hypothetical protein PF002_g18116 [Phytophthora fragariae]|uniref:Uncharacterized protein n=1 Tax=Phytophthora fragariae TaxID=53985 RepID=A0A6A4CZX8_9STRA|nr:hypothetical protein PF003_g27583 [Phytophthora fragariae]KAE9087437.1 hypothetical protein PF007_g20377 [Phytophthora fragariae]KAE9212923.1 hypothetical protein PF002_g18116 [Phytophthora fragariae]KAE9298087.1 hypothetical protein PF001_g16093 [Phytophthora fragariae]
MRRPIQLSESESTKQSKSSSGSSSIEALAQQLKSFMENKQQWQLQLAQMQWQPPRPTQSRAPVVTAAQESAQLAVSKGVGNRSVSVTTVTLKMGCMYAVDATSRIMVVRRASG